MTTTDGVNTHCRGLKGLAYRAAEGLGFVQIDYKTWRHPDGTTIHPEHDWALLAARAGVTIYGLSATGPTGCTCTAQDVRRAALSCAVMALHCPSGGSDEDDEFDFDCADY
jgi:hypothetical protein